MFMRMGMRSGNSLEITRKTWGCTSSRRPHCWEVPERFLANQEWVTEERSFWIFYADVLTTANLNQMLAFHETHGQIATIGVYEVPDPSRCGIVQVNEDGMVSDFIEKPSTPVGNLAFSGLMLATPSLMKVNSQLSARPILDFMSCLKLLVRWRRTDSRIS